MLGTGTSRIYQNITSKHRSETAVQDIHECMAGVDSDGVPTVNRDAYAGMS